MLKCFTVKNFRGFEDELVFDLSKTKDYAFNQECVKNNIVNKGIIYGKNGVGKSNLGLALFDITIHLTDTLKDNSLVMPEGYRNFNSDCTTVSFSYTFQFGANEVCYSYSKHSPSELETEKLVVDGVEKINIDYSDLSKKTISLAGIENLDLSKISDNHISIIKYIYANSPAGANSIISQLVNFVNGMLWFRCLNNGNRYSGIRSDNQSIDLEIIKNNKIDDFQKFLKKNGVSLNIIEKDFLDQKVLYANFKHGSLPLALISSSGTSALTLFYYWSMKFDSLTFLFIDEYDAFYHYETSLIVEEAIKMHSNMQAFLTTHNTYLMNNSITRPDCCFIICNGKIKSLADCTDKEIREGHNLEKMYRNGAFTE